MGSTRPSPAAANGPCTEEHPGKQLWWEWLRWSRMAQLLFSLWQCRVAQRMFCSHRGGAGWHNCCSHCVSWQETSALSCKSLGGLCALQVDTLQLKLCMGQRDDKSPLLLSCLFAPHRHLQMSLCCCTSDIFVLLCASLGQGPLALISTGAPEMRSAAICMHFKPPNPKRD